ncbi:MAG: ribosome maturation factor RimM [Pseudomonadota bacterium]
MSAATPADAAWVVLGRIEGLYGVAGMVKVYSFTDERADILRYPRWWLQQGRDWRPYRVAMGRQQGKTLVAQLEGVVDREQARALLGKTIAVPREQLPPLPPGEYYWSQLEGLQVYNPQGQHLGQVDHLFETGANDVLVVRAVDGSEILIPYTVVQAVDLAAGRLEADWQLDY